MLRAVDVSQQDPVPPKSHLERPEMAWLQVSGLMIDDNYQRPLTEKNWRAIRKIAADFDWSRFTPIMAAPIADGSYAVIDGQHRAHAAALAGISEIPALICDVPVDRQAACFAAINTQRTNITPFHLLKAALASGEDWALAARAAVAAGGCRLMTYNKSSHSRRPGEIYAITLIRRTIEREHGAETVSRVLRSLVESPSSDDPDVYQARVLKPLLEAFRQNPEFMACDLDLFLTEHDLAAVCDSAAALRRTPPYIGLSNFQIAFRCIQALLRQYLPDREQRGAA